MERKVGGFHLMKILYLFFVTLESLTSNLSWNPGINPWALTWATAIWAVFNRDDPSIVSPVVPPDDDKSSKAKMGKVTFRRGRGLVVGSLAFFSSTLNETFEPGDAVLTGPNAGDAAELDGYHGAVEEDLPSAEAAAARARDPCDNNKTKATLRKKENAQLVFETTTNEPHTHRLMVARRGGKGWHPSPPWPKTFCAALRNAPLGRGEEVERRQEMVGGVGEVPVGQWIAIGRVFGTGAHHARHQSTDDCSRPPETFRAEYVTLACVKLRSVHRQKHNGRPTGERNKRWSKLIASRLVSV